MCVESGLRAAFTTHSGEIVRAKPATSDFFCGYHHPPKRKEKRNTPSQMGRASCNEHAFFNCLCVFVPPHPEFVPPQAELRLRMVLAAFDIFVHVLILPRYLKEASLTSQQRQVSNRCVDLGFRTVLTCTIPHGCGLYTLVSDSHITYAGVLRHSHAGEQKNFRRHGKRERVRPCKTTGATNQTNRPKQQAGKVISG